MKIFPQWGTMNPPFDWSDDEYVDPIRAIKEKYEYGHYSEAIKSDIQTLLARISWYKSVSKDMCRTCKSYMEACE